MSDLASLMQVAPGSAAFMMGQNQTQARETEALRQRELQQIIQQRVAEMQQAEQMNPLKLEKARAEAEGLRAGIPGITAQSEILGQSAKKGAATLDSDIDSHTAKNKADTLSNKAKVLRETAKSITEFGPMLEGVPVGLGKRHAALASRFKEMGLSTDNPMVQQLSNMPEAQLPGFLTTLGRKLSEQSEAYIREMDKEKLQQEGATKRQGMANAATLEGKRMEIEAGKYNRNKTAATVADRLLRADSPTKKAEILDTAYYEALAANDLEAAKSYAKRAAEARARVAEDERNRGLAVPRPNVEEATKGRVPNTPAPSATAPIAGQGGPAPAGQPQAGRVRVVGPNGKVGTIPADQLQQALAEGYKKAP